jgi:hypothetical protein
VLHRHCCHLECFCDLYQLRPDVNRRVALTKRRKKRKQILDAIPIAGLGSYLLQYSRASQQPYKAFAK